MGEKRIVEIDGVKIEVDLRNAKRVDTFRVGDNIKILDKESSEYKVNAGVIVDFAEFNELPTMIIAEFVAPTYSWNEPDIKFIHYNSKTADKIEIIPATKDEILANKDSVIERFQREIDKKKKEMENLQYKLDCFKKNFCRAFEEE